MTQLGPRLGALADCRVAFMREYSGLHQYDGELQDLSLQGVRRSLAALGGEPFSDPFDEGVVAAAESAARFRLGELQNHRRDPGLHLEGLDLACYERNYAPQAEREQARRRHLSAWPDAVEAAVSALDRVSKDTAQAFLGPARGLALAVGSADGAVGERALRALQRLVSHLERAAEHGEPEAPIGEERLVSLLGCADAITVDLPQLLRRVEAERERLLALLEDAFQRLRLGRPDRGAVHELLSEHGDFEETVAEAERVVQEASRFAAERQLVPYLEGECLVEPTPPARRWAGARISWVAPLEPLAPAFFHLTPPDPDWDEARQDAWLSRFGPVTLPVITVHEAVPGHHSHAIAMRHVESLPRKLLWSELFFEGWAHYVEELYLEEGFRGQDARFQAGVALEGLVRLVRVECASGVHTGQLSCEEGERLFLERAFLEGPQARAEARRGLFEPTYTRYSMGKFYFQDLLVAARETWGASFSRPRFHRELLALGSPPVGLVQGALGLRERVAAG